MAGDPKRRRLLLEMSSSYLWICAVLLGILNVVVIVAPREREWVTIGWLVVVFFFAYNIAVAGIRLSKPTWLIVLYCLLGIFFVLSLVPFIAILVDLSKAVQRIKDAEEED